MSVFFKRAIDEIYAKSAYEQTTRAVDESEMRRDFRKKVVQMKPRNVLNSSYSNVVTTNTTTNNNTSLNESVNNTTKQ